MACAVKLPGSGDDSIVPGNIFVSNAVQKWFHASDELLTIDAMTGNNIDSATYDRVALIVEILEPQGANFVAMDESPLGDFYMYELVGGGGSAKKVRVTRGKKNDNDADFKINRGNSASYLIGIAGRCEKPLKLSVRVETTGPVVVVKRDSLVSSLWEVRDLRPGSTIGGGLDKPTNLCDESRTMAEKTD
jgi:hypothetical protein